MRHGPDIGVIHASATDHAAGFKQARHLGPEVRGVRCLVTKGDARLCADKAHSPVRNPITRSEAWGVTSALVRVFPASILLALNADLVPGVYPEPIAPHAACHAKQCKKVCKAGRLLHGTGGPRRTTGTPYISRAERHIVRGLTVRGRIFDPTPPNFATGGCRVIPHASNRGAKSD